MSNRVEPEIPSITLDHDQLKSGRKPTQRSTQQHSQNSVPSSSKINSTFTFVIYVLLAGASWFFYQQTIELKATISHSQARIQSLENQLSATGEEMGESTIALKAKLEAITEKTEKLWGEMDKLWASAWRRNQSEIKDLRSASKKQTSQLNKQITAMKNATATINTIKEKQTSTELNLNGLADQIDAANSIQTKIKQLTTQMTSLEEKSSGRDAQQMEVATNVNQLDMSITLLIERLEVLETAQKNDVLTVKPDEPAQASQLN